MLKYPVIFHPNHTDFRNFSSEELEIHPPNIFIPSASLYIDILGDAVFEAEEHVVVALSRPSKLVLPEPFISNKTESPPDSIVKPPDDGRILFDLLSTTIIIQSGI